MTRNPLRLALIAFAAIALVAIGVLYVLPAMQTSEPPAVVEVEDTAPAVAIDITEMQMGNPEAKVTVIEYASYTCPHCATFHLGALDRIKTNYIDTGKINFIYREVYFDRFGLWASMIARCDESKFFGLNDLLYAGQKDWASGAPADVVTKLAAIGKVAGLTDAQLDSCLSDGAKAQALNDWYQANADADGITSTPSFVINGQKYPNMNYQDFAAILDTELAK